MARELVQISVVQTAEEMLQVWQESDFVMPNISAWGEAIEVGKNDCIQILQDLKQVYAELKPA